MNKNEGYPEYFDVSANQQDAGQAPMEGLVESARELTNHIGSSFLKLEEMAQKISMPQSDGRLVIDGVIVEHPDKGLLDQLELIKNKAAQVLKRHSKKILFFGLATLLGSYTGVDNKKIGHFDQKDRAKHELAVDGITEEQRFSGYKAGISELLFRGVQPDMADYKTLERVGRFIPNVIVNTGGMRNDQLADTDTRLPLEERKRQVRLARNDADAWRLYLGLPQKYETFGISDYKPVKETENKYYYRIEKFLENYQSAHPNENPILSLLAFIKSMKAQGKKAVRLDSECSIMGQYTLDCQQDKNGCYISYYDCWDLLGTAAIDNPLIKGVGEAYEIYDRIYYNTKTFDVIKPGTTLANSL